MKTTIKFLIFVFNILFRNFIPYLQKLASLTKIILIISTGM
jgi:hypothetical protein